MSDMGRYDLDEAFDRSQERRKEEYRKQLIDEFQALTLEGKVEKLIDIYIYNKLSGY